MTWTWKAREHEVLIDQHTVIMGVLNVTPDSFSDGGRHADTDRAVARGLEMVEQGARIIDVGGESTRPGSDPVSAAEEIARVVPVIERLAGRTAALISIDTTKASVARAALQAGAHIVNDVSGLTLDPEMAGVVREFDAGLVIMHMRGSPKSMQVDPRYDDVVGEVASFLAAQVQAACRAGIAVEQIVVDPGIGFGKTLEHNLALIRHLPRLAEATGRPVLVGLSRKRWIGAITGREVDDRLAGSLAAMAFAIERGARIIRAHDVKESCDVARMIDTLRLIEDT
jgi:dihydropteroate synthase